MHPTWTLILVVVLAALLFMRPGKLSSLMEDLGKGIKGFRQGMSDQPPAAGTAGRPSSWRRVSSRRRCHSAFAAARSSDDCSSATRAPIWAKPLASSPL